jgi:hypothetical protein
LVASSPWRQVAALVALLTIVFTVEIMAFAWPATRSEPRDVPLVVAGPDPAIAQVRQHLGQSGAFDITEVADRAAAIDAIEDRDAYGAILIGPTGPEVLTASAASGVVAQRLGALATSLAPEQHSSTPMPQVTDVAPAPPDDPYGWGLSAGMLPLVLGGLAAGGAFATLIAGVWRRITGVLVLSVIGGLAMAAIWQQWLGDLDGPYLGNVGVIGLAIAAIATVLIGLRGLIGLAGLGLGAALFLLLGNPLSGMSTAPELLPTGWGELGQLLPPGAAGSLLRSVDFFDDAGAARPLTVLLSWLAAGLVLCLAAELRRRRTQPNVGTPTAASPVPAGAGSGRSVSG